MFDFSVAMTWILFIALFPIALFWVRRAWHIGMRSDHREFALKGGEPLADGPRGAPSTSAHYAAVAGVGVVGVILAVAARLLTYAQWSAVDSSTIWCKFIGDFALSRHARMFGPKKHKA